MPNLLNKMDVVFSVKIQLAHFTVTDGSEAGVDLALMQPFLLYYVNHVVLMLTSIFFLHNFHKKKKEVCIKRRSTSASRPLKG